MKKRILIIAACFIVISAAVASILTYDQKSEHFRHPLSVTVTVNGEKLDLFGTSVQCSYVHTAEPPMILTTYEVLGYSDDDSFTAEFNSVEYWHYYYEFMLPMEKTGFGKNITVRVGEKDIEEAYIEDGLNIDLNLTFTDDTQADAELNIVRRHRNHGITLTEERSLTKQLTLEDAYIESVQKHLFD